MSLSSQINNVSISSSLQRPLVLAPPPLDDNTVPSSSLPLLPSLPSSNATASSFGVHESSTITAIAAPSNSELLAMIVALTSRVTHLEAKLARYEHQAAKPTTPTDPGKVKQIPNR
jgi:hypothetical protein